MNANKKIIKTDQIKGKNLSNNLTISKNNLNTFNKKSINKSWKKVFSNKKEKKTFFANLAKRKLERIIRTKSYFRKNISRYTRRVFKGKRRMSHFLYQINVRIRSNNIFCNLSGLRGDKKTYLSCNAGTYKIAISKKKVKYVYSTLLNQFYLSLKKKIKNKGIIFNITAPVKIRKKVVKTVLHAFKKNWCIIRVVEKKCFNGCRPPKRIRKKRQPRLRLFS